jgi:hypothetical protein
MNDQNKANDHQLPAFPFVIDSGAIEPGLTKRELFAAMAMQGMCAAEDYEGSRWDPVPLAKVAVMRADALLSALKEVQP